MTTEHAPASGRPTLEQVARVAGVSRATVSRVVNGEATVDPRLRELVEQAVTATRYVPNRAARSLVTGRTDSVALVVSEPDTADAAVPAAGALADPVFGRTVTGLLREFGPRGVQLPVHHAADEASRERLLAHLGQGHADGVVLLSSGPADPLAERLARGPLPLVLAGRQAGALPASYVALDQRAGGALAAVHLLERGCTRPAVVAGPPSGPGADPAHRERCDGFRGVAAERGAAEPPVAVAAADTPAAGADAARRLLAADPLTDALFATTDLLALGALAALRDAGRRVPADVAVVGFGDDAAVGAEPGLTTVRRPVEEMAAETARLLLRQIDQRGQRAPSVIFPPTLTVRATA
ncbi:LacI family DNA-binding transcriptional regulator [Streptomyces lonarensis]|uniref:LacI family transcriptional regulator n=1 Tax=Streptomyces lonarensis TaxID=700599 RepID=A0A7X6D4X4_9ACTN|nr:LacI family DNA-binding transcriptional regulator [Streptomyces lonarensis]NJQ08256.1 LacI family transcriptional regulator [Streptomyces lonarensis]